MHLQIAQALLPYPHLDPIALQLGPIAIRWYALAYIAGLLLGWWLILRELAEAKLWGGLPFGGKRPATAEEIGDLVVWAALGVILGGRLGWVLFYGIILCAGDSSYSYCDGLPEGFITHPIKIIAAWQGGMSFHGGLVGVGVAIWLFCRRHKLNMVMIGDLIASVAPIGLFFGRIANFVNGELWGRPSDMPWAMIFPSPLAGGVPRHPSQIYEALSEGVLLLIILQIGLRVFGWNRRPGLMIGVFFLGYGIFRTICEFFREPDAPFLGPVTMGQTLSALMVAVAIFFFWLAFRLTPPPASAPATRTK